MDPFIVSECGAVASGVEAALRIKGKLDQVKVISQGAMVRLQISGWLTIGHVRSRT